MLNQTIEKIIKEIIFKFLNPRDYKVFIFGSRAFGKAKKFSDFDIGIIGKKPVPLKLLGLIEEVFENSDLPVNVDVIDFSTASEKFKKVALSRVKAL